MNEPPRTASARRLLYGAGLNLETTQGETASGIEPPTKLENQPLMHETHCCEDGSFGVADFLGMKYREER